MQDPGQTPGAVPASASDELQAQLVGFCADAGIAYCGLIDHAAGNGQMIASHTATGASPRNPVELSELASRFFLAGRQLATQFGESEAHGLHQCGARWHSFLIPLSERIILLSIFDSDTLVGVVRRSAERWRSDLVQAVAKKSPD